MKKVFYSLFIMATAVLTFSSCEDVPAPFDIPNGSSDKPSVVVDPTGSGTLADPFNVAAAIEFTQQLEAGQESSQDIYIKGKVAAIRENYTTQYGNASFTISDDGTSKATFLVYRALYLGNKKYTSGDLLNEGDEVIVCGKVTNYNGTLETQQNKAFLYSLNGKTDGGEPQPTGDAKGSGTQADPWNPVAAANYCKTLPSGGESDKDYYIKGKISKIANNGEFNAQYGNASFYISEDGTSSGEFYVFRTLYLGNKKWANGDTQIKVGDEVIICGKLTNYMGNTPETVASKSFIYSLNGKTEGGGGDTPTPTPGEAKGSGTAADPWNAVAANQFISKLAADSPTSEVYYIKGKIASIKEAFTSNYGNASFYISDDGKDENTFYVFRTLYLGNKKWADGDTQIKVGDEVVICGKLVNYKGNTPETQQNESYVFSLSGNGGDTPTPDDGSTGTYSNPYSVTSAIAAGSGSGVYVKGYVVGYVSGQVLASEATFTAEGCSVKTNILVAASASETNVENCMPVQLPTGAVRNGVNLQDNPGNFGKEILLYGNIEKYFGATGIKAVSYAEINGSGIGTKP